ncbi:MAG: group 1 glycosyl transferase [Proteobacteria bacterium]|nr:MAG: group 1 glycosyl transferase [Pseudomonadota bacterium]
MGVTARPRKILFVTTDLFVGGGAEGMLVRLLTAEPRLADAITVVSLLPGESHAERLRQAGVTVIQLGFDKVSGIAVGVVRLARLIADTEPDIVQGWMYHGDLAALIALFLSGRRRRTRLVWGIRCSEVDAHLYGLQLRLVVRACAALSRFPDVITANSDAGLKSHLALGYRPGRSAVIANGIDTDRFKPDPIARASLRQELGIAADTFVLAHVARVDPMKDHAGMHRALARMPDVVALFVGSGTERLPAMPNARCLGRRDDVERCFAAADVVVSSSAFGEGFSNVIAEGMACGLPAVATDVGDARIIVGDSGAVVPPRDPARLTAAVCMLAGETPDERARRGARARAHIVERFAMPRALEQFARLYGSLAGGGN